jgi:hypothetical protein
MAKWRQYSKEKSEEDIHTLLQKKSTAIAEKNNKIMEKIMNQLRLGEDQKRYAIKIKIIWGKL